MSYLVLISRIVGYKLGDFVFGMCLVCMWGISFGDSKDYELGKTALFANVW